MESETVPEHIKKLQKTKFAGLQIPVSPSAMSHCEAKNSSKETLVGSEKVRSYCEVKQVASLLSGLNEEKKNAIKSTGFEGLLKLPVHDCLDDSFSLWLLRHLDTESMTLKTPQGVKLELKDIDVRLILGIPCGKKKVLCEKQISGEVVQKVRSLLFVDNPNGSFTTQFLEEVIRSDYHGKMCIEEKISFKISVVLYSLAKFFAPSKDNSKFPMSLLTNFTTPEDIVEYDWTEYVLRVLKESAEKVKDSQSGSDQVIHMYGCTFLLQVFYLDNLEMGLHTTLHMHVPRCHLFQPEYMQKLIQLEKVDPASNKVDNYGKNKVRANEEVCYSRGLSVINNELFQRGEAAFEESLVLLQKAIPSLSGESNCIVAAIRKVATDCATAIKFAYISKHPMHIPKKEDTSEETSPGVLNEPGTIVANACYKIKTVARRESSQAPTRMSRLSTSSKAEPQYDTPPFAIGYFHPIVARHKKMKMYNWIREVKVPFSELTRPWFIHNVPTPIKLTGHDLIASFTMNSMFGYELCDAIMRLFGHLDEWMYSQYNKYSQVKHWRWRHFLPASFSRAVMHHDNGYLSSAALESEFIGAHLKYNLSDCTMIIVPVMYGGRWSCYFWDFQRKRTIVLDPTMMTMPSIKAEFYHDDFVDDVTDALFSCIEKFFTGWKADKDEWSRQYITDIGPKCRMCNSGLNALHYARAFNGLELSWKLLPGSDGNLAEPRAEFLYSLLTMTGNEALLPQGLMKEMNNPKRRRQS